MPFVEETVIPWARYTNGITPIMPYFVEETVIYKCYKPIMPCFVEETSIYKCYKPIMPCFVPESFVGQHVVQVVNDNGKDCESSDLLDDMSHIMKHALMEQHYHLTAVTSHLPLMNFTADKEAMLTDSYHLNMYTILFYLTCHVLVHCIVTNSCITLC